MAIKTNELKVNDIVLAPNATSNRRCIVRAIRNHTIEVDYLDMQTGKMEREVLSSTELEPVHLMESTLYAMGFKKADISECDYPADKYFVLKRSGYRDIAVLFIGQWHLFILDENGSYFDKQELYLHTLQNYLSSGKEIADEVSCEKFIELVDPYCVSPFEPRER